MMYYRLFLQSQKNPFAPVSSSLRADTKKQKCSFREKNGSREAGSIFTPP